MPIKPILLSVCAVTLFAIQARPALAQGCDVTEGFCPEASSCARYCPAIASQAVFTDGSTYIDQVWEKYLEVRCDNDNCDGAYVGIGGLDENGALVCRVSTQGPLEHADCPRNTVTVRYFSVWE